MSRVEPEAARSVAFYFEPGEPESLSQTPQTIQSRYFAPYRFGIKTLRLKSTPKSNPLKTLRKKCRGGVPYPNSVPLAAFLLGISIPRCSYASRVATRPRGVRSRDPI